MAKECYLCKRNDIGFGAKIAKKKDYQSLILTIFTELQNMNDKDVICYSCQSTLNKKHAIEIFNHVKSESTEKQFQVWLSDKEVRLDILPEVEKSMIEKDHVSDYQHTVTTESMQANEKSQTPISSKTTGIFRSNSLKKHEDSDLFARTLQYKPYWNKNGVIQYKDENIAILQRAWGRQVEFIIAYSDLTKEGYQLMAIDEGKTGGQASGGFTGGVNSYYYFQRIPKTQ